MPEPIFKKDIPVMAPDFIIPNRTGLTGVKRSGSFVSKQFCAVFDPSGVTGDRTVAAHGLGVFIPSGAILTKIWYDIVTTFTSASADAGTVALHAQSANDILSAIAISDASNVLDAGIHGTLIGWPNPGADAAHDSQVEWAALNVATYLKLTAQREITATVAVAALTAGKMNIYGEYVISD